MLKASYKRQERYTPGAEPELIGAQYGEIPEALMLGEMALAVRDGTLAKGDLDAAEQISRAIAAATEAGALMTLEQIR